MGHFTERTNIQPTISLIQYLATVRQNLCRNEQLFVKIVNRVDNNKRRAAPERAKYKKRAIRTTKYSGVN